VVSLKKDHLETIGKLTQPISEEIHFDA